jgi:beta-lactam-binding protein with PASTA domain
MHIFMILKQLLQSLFPFICFIGGYGIVSYYYAPQKILMPSLIGLPLDQATALTSKEGLNLQIIEYRTSEYNDQTLVLFQSPVAHMPIKQDQTIYVTCSLKKDPIFAPLLIGKTIHEIEKIASAAGFLIDVYKVKGNQKEGVCFAQVPENGMPLLDNSITIYCSKERDSITVMPLLKGQTLETVILFLQKHEIAWNVATIEKTQSIDYLLYQIKDQRPTAGTIISDLQKLIIDLQIEKVV